MSSPQEEEPAGPGVLVVSHDQVGARMAGPGIRYRGLAEALAAEFRVTLAVPGALDAPLPAPPANQPDGLVRPARAWKHAVRTPVWEYDPGDWSSLAPAAEQAGVVVAAGDAVAAFPALAGLEAPLVVDGYDPHLVETLALGSGEPLSVQIARHEARLAVLDLQCRTADWIICASERQRDWWLGLLEAQGRINPHTYGADPSLRQLVDVVPCGMPFYDDRPGSLSHGKLSAASNGSLPAQAPSAGDLAVQGVWPGVGVGDQIVLWGGGLWQWLDPLTAVRAVGRMVASSPAGRRVRLLFPGTRHPNPKMPDMPMRAETMALADQLGLTGRHVFFGDWVPYDAWPAVLGGAHVGLSLHPETVESRLAYRTRLLDYIWAGLPMVVTEGDSFSEIVEGHELGFVVGYGDDSAVAAALDRLLEEPRAARKDRFSRVRAEMTWERAVRPLAAFCRAPRRAADRPYPTEYSGTKGRRPPPPATPSSVARDAEITRLQELVAGYERGRFMRTMRWLAAWWPGKRRH